MSPRYTCPMSLSEQIAFRFEASLAKRLTSFAKAQARKVPSGVRFTRADAVRMLLEQGLERAGFGAEPRRDARESQHH